MQQVFEGKYGGTDEEFLEWLANYEGGYDDFVSIMKLAGYHDLPSLSEFILSIESTIDPINVLTGELYFTESDMAVPAPGLPLVFERFYASEDGWRNSLAWEFKAIRDKTLESRTVHVLGDYGSWAGLQTIVFTNSTTALDDLDHILLKTAEGQDYRFEMSDTEPGVFYAEAIDWKIVFEEVVENGETNGYRYALHQPGGIVYGFESDKLESIEDAWGNHIDFTHTTNSLLAEHSCGTSLLLEHEGDLTRPTKAYVSDDLFVDYAYDGARQLTNVVRHVSGDILEFTYQYDADGIMTNKTNPRGDEYRFTHDFSSTGNSYSEDYDRTTTLEIGDGWMKHEVAAQWGHYNGTEYRYSDVTYDYGNGLEKKFHYEAEDGLIQIMYGPYTNATGVVTNLGTAYTYDQKNVATEKTFDGTLGESFTIHKQYDGLNHVTAIGVSLNSTNPIWQAHVSYDPVWQLPVATTNAEGHWTQTTYTNARPLSVKAFWSDTQSFDTTFGYTTNGLVKAVTNANFHVTQMEHDANGNPSLAWAELGPVASNTFSALGYLERSETLSESGTSTGRVTLYDVNAKGWVRGVVHPDGLQTAFAYDNIGNVTHTTDRGGRKTDFAYAPTKKLTSVTRYLSEGGSNTPVQIAYYFDKMFNALNITEPRGRYVETYLLDLQDRVTTVTNIEEQAMNIEYGVGNFVRKVTRFDGTTISNAYDNVGRVNTVAYRTEGGSPAATIDYTYWPDGELKTVSAGSSSVSNSYDRLNRLTNVVCSASSASSAIQYQYDPVGNLTNAVVSAGGAQASATAYTYDAAERLEEISTTETQSFTYEYNTENGRIASVSNTASGITCSYEYDLMDRATNITYKTGSGSLIRGFEYEYDAASMITRKAISGGTTSMSSYVYDSLDRLVHETSSAGSAYSAVYKYDLAGNRLSKIIDGLATTYTLGSGNRLASSSSAATNTLFVSGLANELIGTDERWGELWITNWTSSASAIPSVNGNTFFAELSAMAGQTNTLHVAIRDRAGNMGYATKDYWVGTAGGTPSSSSYAYDTAGNTTNLNGVSLEWDERYRLKNVDDASSFVAYEYDVLNRRTSRIEGGTTNYFVYNGNQVAADLDGFGNLLRTYVWGAGIDNLLCFTDHVTSNTYYAIKDHLNSVIALTDDTGSVVESYEYDAYGTTRVFDATSTELTASALGNRYTFQGREIDWTTGLHYFRARWHNPETGHWLSKDLIGIAGGLNLYEAFGSNPINAVDPMGQAYFMSRPLGGAPSNWRGWGSNNPIFDYFNIELSHEQIFFTDDKGGNLGFFKNNKVESDSIAYLNYYRNTDMRNYDDALLRIAVGLTPTKPYSLLGIGSSDKFNCQNWADLVRKVYDIISKNENLGRSCE